jgi:hypothetical protein
MKVQVFIGLPNFFDHQDVLFLQVLVDMTTETAKIVPALLSYRFENFQRLATLLGWYHHPYGR